MRATSCDEAQPPRHDRHGRKGPPGGGFGAGPNPPPADPSDPPTLTSEKCPSAEKFTVLKGLEIRGRFHIHRLPSASAPPSAPK